MQLQTQKISQTKVKILRFYVKKLVALLMLNCYLKWMMQNKKKKQHNGCSEFMSKGILPTQLTWEGL